MADQEPPPQPPQESLAAGPDPAADERTTDPLVRRWSGSAPVPPPQARRRRRWRARSTDDADAGEAAGGGPVPVHRTLELPADELSALRRRSTSGLPIPVTAPLPIPVTAPLPEIFGPDRPLSGYPAPHYPAPSYPAPSYVVPGYPAPGQLVPVRPAAPPRSARPPARPPALPPGRPPAAGWVPAGYPPPGWELRRRRRRRWPWVMLTLGLLTVACCCGCPAYLAKPFWDQYPASVSIPAQAAGLARLDDSNTRQTAQDLEGRVRSQYLLIEDAFAAVYAEPETAANRVTVFGATRFIADPAGDLKSDLPKLTKTTITGVRDLDSGPLGGALRCGNSESGGNAVVVCGWADHGSIGVGIFAGRSIDTSAGLLRGLRAAIITR
jgi:hypothetical protein